MLPEREGIEDIPDLAIYIPEGTPLIDARVPKTLEELRALVDERVHTVIAVELRRLSVQMGIRPAYFPPRLPVKKDAPPSKDAPDLPAWSRHEEGGAH